MSLFRQIWLVIIGVSLALLSGFFALSLHIAVDVQKAQQAERNLEAARLLPMQWQNLSTDDPKKIVAIMRSLTPQASFDEVIVQSLSGQTLYQVKDSGDQSAMPAWFREWFPINTPPAVVMLRHDNKNVAKVLLSRQRGPLYDSTWNAVILLLVWMGGGMFLVGIICNQVLRRIKRPINAVIEQAEAIARREFNPIPIATLPEMKPVTIAMNDMVMRLKTMFNNEAARLEEVRKEANLDRLTGLYGRDALIAQLQKRLQGEEASDGALLFIRILGLMEANRIIGRAATDQLIKSVAHQIQTHFVRDTAGFAGRMNGTDLALCWSNANEAEKIAPMVLEKIKAVLDQLGQAEMSATLRFAIGVTAFGKNETLSTVLSRVDTALANAEAVGEHSWKMAENHLLLLTHHTQVDWQKLFESIGAGREIKLASFPVVTTKGEVLHYECPLRLKMHDADNANSANNANEWANAGTFLPMAIRLKQTVKLDTAAINLALKALTAKPSAPSLAVTVSGESLVPTFIDSVRTLLSAKNAPVSKLCIEISENDVYRHFDAFREFSVLVKQSGAQIGIKHFGRRLNEVSKLHSLGLDYFKVDSAFIHAIHQNVANQAFLGGVVRMAHSIGAVVVAVGITQLDEVKALLNLEFDAITGPFVQ